MTSTETKLEVRGNKVIDGVADVVAIITTDGCDVKINGTQVTTEASEAAACPRRLR